MKASILIVILWWMLVEYAMCDYQTLKWKVQYKSWSPDGVKGRKVIAINGHFPGPTIRASVGDHIVVVVTNRLTEQAGLSIHWHGIRQFGTPWSDGTANISQCPTPSGAKYTYNFTLDKTGTYFYHAHNKMLRVDGCYGMLIVEDDEEQSQKHKLVGDLKYDGELELLLSDWWHKNSTQQEAELSSVPMIWIGEPQSLLMNGRGQYICSMSPGVSKTSNKQCRFHGSEEYAPFVLRVNSTKTYRLRLASAASLASLNFAIEGHALRVVEADGNLVKPFCVHNMNIFPGQSYSVLVTANQDPSKTYWVSASVIARNPNTTRALTLLTYDQNDSTNTIITLPTTTPPLHPAWNDTTLMKDFARKIRARTPGPPKKYDVRLYLLNTQNRINGSIKWAINNISLSLPATPYLGAIKYGLRRAFNQSSPPTKFSRDYDVMSPAKYQNVIFGDGIYRFRRGEVVDVVLQNANALGRNTSETHPWHLHGHDFWVMGYGEGRFEQEKDDETRFNVIDPPLRNTEVVFPYGWTALRFVADNPGVWAFHCHVEAHMHMGMGVVFAEGTEELRRNVPAEGLRCGMDPN